MYNHADKINTQIFVFVDVTACLVNLEHEPVIFLYEALQNYFSHLQL